MTTPTQATPRKKTPAATDATRTATSRWPLILVIFLVSLSSLAYEITLTRIFSLLFQYHYAFLALSLVCPHRGTTVSL